jgi:molybdopterin molybdotransferase
VAIFSSGNELVAPGEPLPEGSIYNSNRYTLLGLLTALGCQIVDLGTIADDLSLTCQTLDTAAQLSDVVITTGGVSVGEEDHIKQAVQQVGRLELWRIAIKPGKPLAYGRIGEADFLGLPGNPVSALVTFCLFVRPFLLRRQGVARVEPRFLPMPAGFDWPKPRERREYVRARLAPDGSGRWHTLLFPKQGSDVLTSAVWADGLVEIKEGQTIARGDTVSYLSFAELLNLLV